MTRARRTCTLACALTACVLGAAASAGGQRLHPISLGVSVSPVARLHGLLPITVSVTADLGVLDTRSGPLRVRVKLARECGAAFASTVGTLLLDRRLAPQPDPGEPYQGTVNGSGKPSSYGAQSVCVFLEDEAANRLFADDTDNEVDVSRPCTDAARRYDVAAGALSAARASLAHAHGGANRSRLQKLVASRTAALDTARRKGRSACGAELPL